MLGFALLALLAASPDDAYDVQGEDVIPALFHGEWAPTAAECKDEDKVNGINVSATHVTGYEFQAKLLKHSGLDAGPDARGRNRQEITLLVAESGEGDVSFGRIRLGLRNGKLYFDRPKEKYGPLNITSNGYVHCALK